MDDRELAAPGAALARLVEQLGEQSALDGVAARGPRTRRRGASAAGPSRTSSAGRGWATRCTRCSPTSRSASGRRRSLSTCSADGTRAGRPPASSRGACSRRCPTAATGASDWSDDRSGPNGASASCTRRRTRPRCSATAASWVERRRGRHWHGVALGLGGRVRGDGRRLPRAVTCCGQPGSVSTTPRSGSPPSEWTAVMPVSEVSDDPGASMVDGAPVIVFRHGGTIVALDAQCPHRGAPMAEGRPRRRRAHLSVARQPVPRARRGTPTRSVDLPTPGLRVPIGRRRRWRSVRPVEASARADRTSGPERTPEELDGVRLVPRRA